MGMVYPLANGEFGNLFFKFCTSRSILKVNKCWFVQKIRIYQTIMINKHWYVIGRVCW